VSISTKSLPFVVAPSIPEIDVHSQEDFAAALRACPPDRNLVVDLSSVVFFSSTGIAVLVAAERDHEAHGTTVRVVNATPAVVRVLELCDLDTRFGLSSS
jgi:anti-anti-sigma factor